MPKRTWALRPQQRLLHLAHGVARQLGHDEAALGDLEVGQLRLELGHDGIGVDAAPDLAVTTATPTSPKSGCGTPTSALSATPAISLM
jgi:hypothetical protein